MPPSHPCTSVSMPGLDSCHRHCFPGPQVAISSGHTHTTGTPMGDGKCLVSPGPGAGLLSHICFWKLLESTVFPRACCVVAMSHQARCQMQCLGGKPSVALHSRHAALSLGVLPTGCCPAVLPLYSPSRSPASSGCPFPISSTMCTGDTRKQVGTCKALPRPPFCKCSAWWVFGRVHLS